MRELTLPGYQDVVAAAERINGFAHRTPVLTTATANKMSGAELFFKCENFQRMGAFKFRGAMNALLQFSMQQKKHGVVAFSSGNHAQGIALSAKLLGIPATIVMPQDAPASKVAATRGYGADVVLYDRYTEDREKIGQALADKHGMTLIPLMITRISLPGKGRRPKSCLKRWAILMRCLCVSVAAVYWPVQHWLHVITLHCAKFTVLNRRRAMTGSNRSAAVKSFISKRQKPLPMVHRRNISANTPSRSFKKMLMTSLPSVMPNWFPVCAFLPNG